MSSKDAFGCNHPVPWTVSYLPLPPRGSRGAGGGYATGDLDADAYGLRLFVARCSPDIPPSGEGLPLQWSWVGPAIRPPQIPAPKVPPEPNQPSERTPQRSASLPLRSVRPGKVFRHTGRPLAPGAERNPRPGDAGLRGCTLTVGCPGGCGAAWPSPSPRTSVSTPAGPRKTFRGNRFGTGNLSLAKRFPTDHTSLP